MTSHIPLPRAMLFDMDGTLTRPHLDFPRIKRAMGIDVNQPILESLEGMSDADRTRATKILHQYEEEAAMLSELNDGCRELLLWLQERQIQFAVITRNSRQSVATVFARHGLEIDLAITRDDGVFKPAPDPLHRACERLGVLVADAWMVGDGSHDLDAAAAAGMTSVWISHGQTTPPSPVRPSYIFRDLLEMHSFLKSCDSFPAHG